MNHQPVAQSDGGMSVPDNEHDLRAAIKELKHQWAGYAELPAMVRALEDRVESLDELQFQSWWRRWMETVPPIHHTHDAQLAAKEAWKAGKQSAGSEHD